jgi:hypothetical protein
LPFSFHCQVEASFHAWIDAIFFRASTMLSQNQQLVLGMMKQIAPGSELPELGCPMYLTGLSEFADYAAMIVEPHLSHKSALTCVNHLAYSFIAGEFRQDSPLKYMPSSFFVVEAKMEASLTKDFYLVDYIPQAVYQMFKCAKVVQ